MESKNISQVLATMTNAPSGQALSRDVVPSGAVCKGTFGPNVHVACAVAASGGYAKPVGNPIVVADAPTKHQATRVFRGRSFTGHDMPRAARWMGASKCTTTDQIIPQIPPSAVQRSP